MPSTAGGSSDSKLRIIRSDEELDRALTHLRALLDLRPQPSTPEAEEAEVLSILIEHYEKERGYALPAPTAIEAILFRMEQEGLKRSDLVPFLGSASRVSEVLAGKRPLTVRMIRALHEGLGIPTDVLLSRAETEDQDELDVSRYPVAELQRRGWLPPTRSKSELRKALLRFLEPVSSANLAIAFRRSIYTRGENLSKNGRLEAWVAALLQVASRTTVEGSFSDESVSAERIRQLVQLSWAAEGPRLALDFLSQQGIAAVVVPHLTGAALDGASILDREKPVIGLSLRYDRLDSFWFTLLHEVAHISMHLDSGIFMFVDDLDAAPSEESEAEADTFATDALIPLPEWERSPASRLRSRQAVEHLARKLGIHPAIVAGKIRRAYNDYSVLSDLVGQGEVRKLFAPEWQAKPREAV